MTLLVFLPYQFFPKPHFYKPASKIIESNAKSQIVRAYPNQLQSLTKRKTFLTLAMVMVTESAFSILLSVRMF